MDRFLVKQGFSVITAASGIEGLRLAREARPAAITLDVMMPDLDGWTVLAALKGDPALAGIPVIVVTIVDEKARGYSLGATDYMVKPIERERLAAVLKTLCGEPAGASRPGGGRRPDGARGRQPDARARRLVDRRGRERPDRPPAGGRAAPRRDRPRSPDAGAERVRVPRRPPARPRLARRARRGPHVDGSHAPRTGGSSTARSSGSSRRVRGSATSCWPRSGACWRASSRASPAPTGGPR